VRGDRYPAGAAFRFIGHANITSALTVYTRQFGDDHAETMAALEALRRAASPNVVPMRRQILRQVRDAIMAQHCSLVPLLTQDRLG
jgi:acyl-CoA reductase-like NAD-dependent aldehyde dehydrogenase